MKFLLTAIFLLLASVPAYGTVYYARSDGSNATNCLGTTDAAYDGSGTGEACAYTLSVAITQAACADTVRIKAGQTFDGSFTLTNKSCTIGNPVTLTSTNFASLPSTTVTAADATNMPRIRTTTTSAVFTTATNAGWWVLDGLEITDNSGTSNINTYLDWGSSNSGAHDMVFTRNYVHQKETGASYTRSAVRVMIFNGTGLDYTKNLIQDFIGIPYGGSTEPHNSEALLVGSGGDILFELNNSTVWYNHLFLGGSDTAANHTATLTGASTTSATYSNVTGVAVGQFHRFSIPGTATLSNSGNTPTLTRLTGPAWVTADGNTNGNWGDSVLITSVASPSLSGIVRFMSLTGDNVFTTQIASSSAASVPNGTVDYVLYQTARVTNVAGSVITYDPNGTVSGINYDINALNKTPSSVAWNVGDEGRIIDVTIRKNTLNNNPTFATYLQGIGRGCPKGMMEVKNVDRFTFEGNVVTGYPAVLAFTAANQNGTAPWITVNNVTIQNNWIKPDTGYTPCSRSAILMSDDAYLNTITPTTTVTITNNLITGGVRSFAELKNGVTWTLTHNTVENTQGTGSGYNAMLIAQGTLPTFVYTDNISANVCYGFMNYPANYPSRTIDHNVIVDTDAGCSGGINVNTWGTASALSPIPTAYSAVGFTNLAGQVYSLAPSSAYKGLGNGGTDPGVDWNALQAALAPSATVSPTSMKGRVTVGGRVTIR